MPHRIARTNSKLFAVCVDPAVFEAPVINKPAPAAPGRARAGLVRRLLWSTALLGGTLMPVCAQAQVVAQAPNPKVRESVDENGVDVISGTLQVGTADLAIGPNSVRGLAYSRMNGVATQAAYIESYGSSGGYIVVLNGVSETFDASFVSTEGRGASLSYAGGVYKFTTADGTEAYFATNSGYSLSFLEGELGRLGYIIYPDGTKHTFSYRVEARCSAAYDHSGEFPPDECEGSQQYVSRLESVISSTGYQLKILYGNNTSLVDPLNYATWGTPTQVVAVNNADQFCDQLGTSCTATGPAPAVNYSAGDGTDATGRPVKTWVSATYNPDATVASATLDGVTHTYTYATNGTSRTTTVTDPANHSRVYVADLSTNLLSSFTDELNHTTSYTYDSNGRVTRIVLPEGNAVDYAYDARGNLTQTTNEPKPGSSLSNIVTTASYPSTCSNPKTCNKPTATVDARGAQTDYTYDANHGGLLTVTRPADPNGVRPQTRYSYAQRSAYFKASATAGPTAGDPIWVLTGTSTCAVGATCAGSANETISTIDYGPQTTGTANNLLPDGITRAAGNNAVTATTEYAYDRAGNAISIDGPLSGTADTQTRRYDAARRVIGSISADPDGSGPLKRRATRLSYDPRGQVSEAEQGTVTGTADADWSAFVSLQQLNSTFDGNYRKVSDTLTAGGTTYALSQYSYDALGRSDCTTQRLNPATFGSLPAACSLGTAGGAGNDRIARTTYDAAGQVATRTTAYGTSDTATESLTYTANSQVATITDADGNLTAQLYDGFDRPGATRFPDPTTKGVANTADYRQPTYDANGNVVSERLRDGQSISYTYDALDRVTTKTRPTPEGSVSFTYDLFGRMLSAADATSGLTNALGYDALDRLTNDGQAYGSMTYQYDAAGRRTRMTWADGFYATYDYLPTGEMSTVKENGSTVLGSYTYDDLGRATGLNSGNGTTTSYGYDAVSRLTSLAHDLAGTAKDVTTSLTYNPASQIASIARTNDSYAYLGLANVNRSYTVNGRNQLISAGSDALGYDARGNLTSAGPKTYTYSSENLLTGVSGGVSIVYDPLLRMVSYNPGTATRFVYDGGAIAAEMSTSGAVLRRYVPGTGVDNPLIWYEGSGITDKRWLPTDERGSVIAVANTSGDAIKIDSYDEYGDPGAGNVGRLQYTGQAWLPEAGVYYYKARMYAPRLGRFLQTDPIDYGDGLNWYSYVGNDPVDRVDSSGLKEGAEVPGPKYLQDGTDASEGQTVIVIGRPNYLTPVRAAPLIVGSGGQAGSSMIEFGGATYDAVVIARKAHPKRQDKKPVTCHGRYNDLDAVADFAGNVALGADVVAVGAGVAAIGTSLTGVGGVGFGSIAAGAKLVSLGATGVQAAFQYVNGNISGFKSTLAGSAVGALIPGLLGAKQAVYGVGKSARDVFVRDAAGVATGQMASAAACK